MYSADYNIPYFWKIKINFFQCEKKTFILKHFFFQWRATFRVNEISVGYPYPRRIKKIVNKLYPIIFEQFNYIKTLEIRNTS